MVAALATVKLISPSQPLANGVGFVCATGFSYVVNTLWSFSTTLHGYNLAKYVTIAFAGFCVAIAISTYAQAAGFNYLIGILLVSCAVPPVNFAMHNLWTYR
jgi:putative flippase GtrA